MTPKPKPKTRRKARTFVSCNPHMRSEKWWVNKRSPNWERREYEEDSYYFVKDCGLLSAVIDCQDDTLRVFVDTDNSNYYEIPKYFDSFKEAQAAAEALILEAFNLKGSSKEKR